MDPKDLHSIELPAVLERLSGHTHFSASNELAKALAPAGELEEVRRRLAETSQALDLFQTDPGIGIGGARDVRSPIQSAERGAVLEPHQLLDIKATLISSRTLGKLFAGRQEEFPALAEIALDLVDESDLIDRISRTLDDRAQVLDTASRRLGQIRSQLKVARERLGKKLDRLVADPKIVPLLQEPIITQRDGRSVVPLRSEFKGKLEGVIHDQSSSGATIFIEPLQIVEANNAVRELELAERDEVIRILAELSAAIGEQADVLAASVKGLARLDLAFAKGRYAQEISASLPIVHRAASGNSRLRLRSARHPLLDPELVIPIDLDLEPDVYSLVITGPNTGGKTVTLKTAGLLVAMALCGLHIPAEAGSQIALFTSIYADIGEEQSIEQSLSTFSSHISNIVRILESAGDRSLVLLDELGAGTDPGEGAALARALLEEFVQRGSTSLVATHFPELKTYAHSMESVRNANVEFDLESLRPTYRLTIGLPGRSNALAIAERLGLDERIVERAREHVSPDELQADQLLDEIRQQRDAAEEARSQAEQASAEARELRDGLEERLDGIADERREVLEKAHQESRQEASALRRELERLRVRMAAMRASLQPVQEVQEALEEVEDRLTPDQPALVEIDFSVGDRVRIRSIAAEGVIRSIEGDQADVQAGRIKVRARLDELRQAEPQEEEEVSSGAVTARIGAALPPTEIHLRGKTVDEALVELERWLDDAYMAGIPSLRVVHGKGTGKLRQAVRDELRRIPYVASFETAPPAEGGEGVTVVRLEQD